jgi:hypothetical protein
MPAATVESAYLSNPEEAAMMATEAYRQQVAQGVVNGLLAYTPDIATRSTKIAAAEKAQQAAAAAAARAQRTAALQSHGGVPLLQWMVVAALGYAAYRYRAMLVPRTVELVGYGISLSKRNRHRVELRRRRATVRARALAVRSGALHRQPSVYDDIAL